MGEPESLSEKLVYANMDATQKEDTAYTTMLVYHRTSLFTSNAQTVVNTVNCVGVMGKGIAAEFKRRHPAMFAEYKRICDEKKLTPGKLWLWQGSTQWILNFPTKKHWRYPSKLEWIEAGLKKFVDEYEKRGIVEVSFPRLGCGNGGLNWDDVKPLMETYLRPLPIRVYVHDFEVNIGVPEHMRALVDEHADAESITASYQRFSSSLRRSVERMNGSLTDIHSSKNSSIFFENDGELVISNEDISFSLDEEALHGLWASLQKGLVTRRSVETAVEGASDWVLSLLATLPDVRPVQIERSNSSCPELAVEVSNHRKSESIEGGSEGQLAFRWP